MLRCSQPCMRGTNIEKPAQMPLPVSRGGAGKHCCNAKGVGLRDLLPYLLPPPLRGRIGVGGSHKHGARRPPPPTPKERASLVSPPQGGGGRRKQSARRRGGDVALALH